MGKGSGASHLRADWEEPCQRLERTLDIDGVELQVVTSGTLSQVYLHRFPKGLLPLDFYLRVKNAFEKEGLTVSNMSLASNSITSDVRDVLLVFHKSPGLERLLETYPL